MSLVLPSNPETLEKIDLDMVTRKEWATFREAKHHAAAMFAADSGFLSINFLVIRANDDIELISIGPRGGVKIVWKFGNLH